jgi:hypothetical protein
MSREALEALYQDLLQELADIEREQHDTTLSHSDQQVLDQAWEDCMQRMEETEDRLAELQANTVEDTRPDCSRCAGCAYCGDSSPGYDESDEL